MMESRQIFIRMFFCGTVFTLFLYGIAVVRTCIAARWRVFGTRGSSFIHQPIVTLKRFAIEGVRGCSHTPDNITIAVWQLFERKSLSFIQRFLLIGAPALAIVYVRIAIRLFERWDSDGSEPKRLDYQDGHAIIGLLFLSLATLAQFGLRQPTIRVCMAFQVACMCRLLWSLHKHPNGSSMIFDRQYVFVIRLAIGVVPGDVRFSIAANILYSLLSIRVFASYHKNGDQLVSMLPSDSVTTFFQQEFLSCVVLSTVILNHKWQRYVDAHAVVKATASQNLQVAVGRLLQRMYDVVIELDSNLCFVSAEALSGLMLHGYKRSVKGICIEELIASPEEKLRFRKYLASPEASGVSEQLPAPFRMSLKGSDGAIIRVETLSSRIQQLDKTEYYLLGITELGIETYPEMPASIDLRASDDYTSEQRSRPRFQGTPANVARDALSDLPSVSSNRSSKRPIPILRVSDFQETTIHGKQLSLLHAIMRWNIQLPAAQCCELHSLIKEASCQIKSLAKEPCSQSKMHSALEFCNFQCPSCRLFVDDELMEGECPYCGSDVNNGIVCSRESLGGRLEVAL